MKTMILEGANNHEQPERMRSRNVSTRDKRMR